METIHISNCPNCDHFPTQCVETPTGIEHRHLVWVAEKHAYEVIACQTKETDAVYN